MKRLDAGTTGARASLDQESDLGSLGARWSTIIDTLLRGRTLRPVQHAALHETRILDSRQHLVVCAPTNSGKSLVGHLILLDAVLQGRRAVLLEPLRALAQEQFDELSEVIAALVPTIFEHAPKVRISTGDYRLDGELPADPAPGEGEIIVATPERLDAILRNAENAAWASTIGAVVIDEAHLLADPRRGPTLELVAASMLSLQVPPRIVLLSATVGEPERLREWLSPCQLITSTARSPLKKEVWQLDANEDPDEVLNRELSSVLADSGTAAIVFIYRRDTADALSRRLAEALGQPVLAYHSGQSASERLRIRTSFRSGACRCLVATTSLAMGVNLPATHVLVRDTTFFGFGKLRVDELLQILGRAGRGDRSGLGAVLVRPSDDWECEKLAHALREEDLPPLRSSFEAALPRGGRDTAEGFAATEIAAASLVATCLGRAGSDGLPTSGLSSLLKNTLGARSLVPRIDESLRWLADPSRALTYRDDTTHYHLTVLGHAGVRSMLPLGYVGGIGQLTRDLISLDATSKLLGRWSGLDHLLVMSLASERGAKPRRFSEDLAGQIDAWHESRPSDEKSLLFAEWVMGSASRSKADELLGSLGLSDPRPASGSAGSARKRAYVAMLAAIILDERSRGTSVVDLERRWGVSGLQGTEEAWRDSALWMVAGHTMIFEVRAFYHHLREHCAATPEQVRDVKRALGRVRGHAYDVLERLKYCSPLGPLMRGVRETLRASKEPTLGVGTIRKLEAAGVTNIQQVAQMGLEDMVNAGVQRRFAKQIRGYIRRRMR
jgi:superfamily II DNA/RNA helicase